MVEEIWQELAKAKYLEWENASTSRSWELQSLKYVFPVSFRDIFRDPVITPSGVTYERAMILDHLQKVMFLLDIACLSLEFLNFLSLR